MSERASRPGYVDYALMRLWTLEHAVTDRRYIETFSSRWNGLDQEALAHALAAGGHVDRLFAILALGHMRTPETHALLLPLLQSPDPLERWASATVLAQVGEQQTLPVLCAMLTEFLPTQLDEYFAATAALPYENQRSYGPRLLGMLGDVRAVPALRQALYHVVRLIGQSHISDDHQMLDDQSGISFDKGPEIRPTSLAGSGALSDTEASTPADALVYRQGHAWAPGGFDIRAPLLDNLLDYLDEIVYALGRLSASGVLTGLWVKESHLQVWTVHLAVGYLHGGPSWLRGFGLDLDPGLKADIGSLLEHYFGLTQEEQEQAIFLYMATKANKLTLKYKDEKRMREQGEML